jgi:hypothetical protein
VNEQDREEEDERVKLALDEENRGSIYRRMNAIRARWFDALVGRVLGR